MRRRVLCGLVALSACGRFGFDPDGRGDGGTAGDGRAVDSALSFCANLQVAHDFCDDFDDGTTNRWDNTFMTRGTVSAASGSLIVATQAITAGQSANPIVERGFGSATHIVMSFDVSAPIEGAGDPVVLELQLNLGSDRHYIEYVHRTTGAYIEEYVDNASITDTFFYYDLPAPAAGVHRIELDVLTGTNPTLTVKLDGGQILGQVLMDGTAGTLIVQLGVPFLNGPSPPWQLQVDNVLVDLL